MNKPPAVRFVDTAVMNDLADALNIALFKLANPYPVRPTDDEMRALFRRAARMDETRPAKKHLRKRVRVQNLGGMD
jgi:hypothetical protein